MPAIADSFSNISMKLGSRIVNIKLREYSDELYGELNRLDFISRMEKMPQLGVIPVKKRLRKSRYEYVKMQLYLHQLVQMRLNEKLRYSYGGNVCCNTLNLSRNDYPREPSIMEVIQILILIYNAGHFYNTFTASRTVIELASEDDSFARRLQNDLSEVDMQIMDELIEKKNYLRIHIVNAMLILNRCNQNLKSVSLAKAILRKYAQKESLEAEHKLSYIFLLFTKIRSIAYVALDLQIASIPMSIDLRDEKALVTLLGEYLSELNDQTSSVKLVESISKLLDDVVYNESSETICSCGAADRMAKRVRNNQALMNNGYYEGYFIDGSSPLNSKVERRKDYDQSQILKLTFDHSDSKFADELLMKLRKMQNTRTGYYNRANGDRTLLIALKKNISMDKKRRVAFRVMQTSVTTIRQTNPQNSGDSRYLLCAKFYLYYLFNENPLVIKPTLTREAHVVQKEVPCVFCTKGNASRVQNLEKLLEKSEADCDAKHEVEFMKRLLDGDPKRDTTICIPASIEIHKKDEPGKQLCELDGMIIHPMRKNDQVVFLEAKNKTQSGKEAKKCLKKHLERIGLKFRDDDVLADASDAYLMYSESEK